jgi:hypothetical protein
MKLVLIDTNCWIDLLSAQNEKALSLLEHWVEAKKIFLIVPQQLKSEWETQKDSKLKASIKAQNELGTFQQFGKIETDNVRQRIDRIDELFNKSKIIKPSLKVNAEVTLRFTNKQAPFHRSNNNSNSDALIYLTAIEYLKKKKEKKFIFVTRDGDDFGDPSNPKKELHADLVIPGIQTEYIYNIGNAFKTLQEELGDLKDFESSQNADYVSRFQLLSSIQNLSILDQVVQVLKKYEDQISIIPTNILVRIYPFKIDNKQHSYTYHSSFTINSNNKRLVELFKAVELIKTKRAVELEENFELQKKANMRKAEYVIRRLNRNLIFEINQVNHSISADLRFLKDTTCNCVLCSYNRYDFVTSLRNLSQTPLAENEETMKHAYVHFQFGNFTKSLELFYHVFIKSKNDKKHLQAFICLYNLKRLKHYIQGYSSEASSETSKIINDVDKLSLQEIELIATTDPFVQEVIRWILNSEFYHTAYREIFEVGEKIRSHYNTQIAGGFSSNSNFSVLLSNFGEIDNFLDHNYIIYNNYGDFEEVANKFVEGILTIYSLDDRQSERLSYIDDSLLILISRHAKRESIVTYYNRVNLSKLKHRHTSKTEPSLEKTFLKLTEDYENLKGLYYDNSLRKMFFWDKYRKIFSNLLLFITVAESQSINYNAIFKSILDIIEDDIILRKFDDKIIAEFIIAKGKYLESTQLHRFFKISISNKKFHEHRIFYCFKKIISQYHKDLIINDEQLYSSILQNFFEKCPKCNSFHDSEILTQIFFILEKSFQQDLVKRIETFLVKEFKTDLYYSAAIYGIIDYKLFFDQYLSLSLPPPKGSKIRHSFDRGVVEFSRLNEILNLAFKYDIDLSAVEFTKFAGISDYYDWLLNMDEFDYSKFEPLWILAYQTDIYKNKIFTNDKVKEYLKKWLRKTKHPYISELFIKHS